MLKNKYKAFLKDLKYEFYVPIEYNTINEDVAIELGKLRKGNITKNYTIDKWNNLLSAKYNNFPEIICGIFKAENVPDEIYDKIINEFKLTDRQILAAICCDKLNESQVEKIKEMREIAFWDSVFFGGNNLPFSQVFLNCICNLKPAILEKFNYSPFEKVNNKYTNELIHKMLKNDKQEFFEKEISESFLTAIENNEHLPDEFRDAVFDIGFLPTQLTNMTEYMKKEVYKIYADNIFEIKPISDDEKNLHMISFRMIKYMMQNNILPECCQLDFVSRFQHKTFDIDDSVYKWILSKTTSEQVLDLACEYNKMGVSKYNNYIIFNDNLTERIANKLFPYFPNNVRKEIFLQVLSNSYPSDDMLKEFALFDDNNLNKIISLYPQTPESVFNIILSNNKYDSYWHVLSDMTDFLHKIENDAEKDAIMNFLVYIVCINGNKNTDKPYDYYGLACMDTTQAIEIFCGYDGIKGGKFRRISNESYNMINDNLEKLKKEYPEQNSIIKVIQSKIQDVYDNSKLLNAFPDIFKLDYTAKNDMRQTQTDIRKLIDISDNEEKRLIQLIEKETNAEVLAYVKSEILNSFRSLCTKENIEDDNVYFGIYNLNNIYTKLNDRIREIDKEKNTEVILDER